MSKQKTDQLSLNFRPVPKPQRIHINPRLPDGRAIDDPSITTAELEH